MSAGYPEDWAIQVGYSACGVEAVYYAPGYLAELGMSRGKKTAVLYLGPMDSTVGFEPKWEPGAQRKVWRRFLMKVHALASTWAASDRADIPASCVKRIADDGVIRLQGKGR